MTLHLRIGSKLSIFQLYISVSLVLLQLFKFVKSDFAANLEDYMSFNKRVIRQGAIVTSVESSTVEPKLMIKKHFLV